ncbi:hypothetical protein [Paraclostridium sp. AKS81]|uniref:hypothetical protein n=1 Tax=Paraclostridium sp. AKS81 TaxID=2876117 RepID=UPI0021DF86BF|nr:hypothetical protein [Paraclostridium sp. AKS81]MCU9812949.1 hypothetical protein [Paraclostridium sp. AKS81]
MKKILVPIKSKLKPVEVNEEIKNLNMYTKVHIVRRTMILMIYHGSIKQKIVLGYQIIGILNLMERYIVNYAIQVSI